MSSHASTKIDQKEYLKKYLSGDKVKKKKKDKKRKKDFGETKVKIIDDDVAYTQTQEDFDEELLLGGEDAPQIVGEYAEEPTGKTNVPKWRSIVKEEIDEELDNSKVKRQPEDLWGQKQTKLKIKDEFSPTRRNANKNIHQNTPDNTPPRRKNREGMSNSDGAKKQHLPPNNGHQHVRKHSPFNDSRSPDQSPLRKNKRHTHTPDKFKNGSSDHSRFSTKNKYNESNTSSTSDQSPPKKHKHKSKKSKYQSHTTDLSPQRSNKHSSLLDFVPTRNPKGQESRGTPMKESRKQSVDQSPPRRRSPGGRNQRSPSTGMSPSTSRNRQDRNVTAKKNNHKRSADISPPRRYDKSPQRRKKRSPSKDLSPPRNRKNKERRLSPEEKSRGSSRDQSPARRYNRSPQKRKHRSPSSDLSPPRSRKNRERKLSPVKRSRKSSSDQSPPRRSPSRKLPNNTSPVRIKLEKFSNDQSPPRRAANVVKKERSPSASPPRRSRWSKLERKSSDSPPPTHKPKASKTLDGKKAGLQDAKSLTKETEERRQREERMYNDMSREISGRDAEVQVRSTGRKGQRARDAAAEDPEVRRRKEEHERKKKEKYDRWGKGLKQIEEHKQRREAESYEGSKPLARYENDEDLDRYLREQERADDPMLDYMRKKKKERQKEEGAVVEMPKYEGTYPENRFGIRPGYRWDGVDRSNGFEKKWFDVQNEKRAAQEEAYLYSVEDM